MPMIPLTKFYRVKEDSPKVVKYASHLTYAVGGKCFIDTRLSDEEAGRPVSTISAEVSTDVCKQLTVICNGSCAMRATKKRADELFCVKLAAHQNL